MTVGLMRRAPRLLVGGRPSVSIPARIATIAASSTGIPAGTNGVVSSATATAPAATSWARRAFGPVTRGHTRPRNAAAAAASRPYLRGSPSASPSSAPRSVNVFHRTKTPIPVHQNPSREARRPAVRGRDGGRLVDGQLCGCEPSPAAHAEQRGDLRAVEPVAHTEQPGRRDGGPGGTARADHADERELRAAGEHQQAQRHRLRQRQARRDGERAERDAVEAGGQRDGDGLADRRPAVVGFGHGLGDLRWRRRRCPGTPRCRPRRPRGPARTTSRRRRARSRPRRGPGSRRASRCRPTPRDAARA